jgi:predicted Fe-S protein YdhL (DUF1289 family)
VKTACKQRCLVLPGDFHCDTCGRTLEQIRDWSKYTDEQREKIIKELDAKRKQ